MSASPRGHVFVVRGKIGNLVADAQIISTDDRFSVREQWHDLIGVTSRDDALRLRPRNWSTTGWGTTDRDDTWFLDVTGRVTEGLDQFGRLTALLHELGERGLKAGGGRVVPLVVLPVVGTQGGGFASRRGEVITRLLETCLQVVQNKSLDVAIVTTSPSTYAALQSVRRAQFGLHFDGVDRAVAEDLGGRAKNGSLALFLGAGTSIPAGAPSWDSLIKGLAAKAGVDTSQHSGFSDLTPLDQAQLIQDGLTSPDDATRPGTTDRLGEMIKESLSHVTQPALAHALLAALDCDSAVTTNYDHLYERAVAYESTVQDTSTTSRAAVSVLPAELPQPGTRWILKMHGDIDRPGSVVLTRGQFVGFQAASGPAGAVLQSLMLTKHLLVVGTSFNDDNLLRLIHEVAAFRRPFHSTNGEEKFGTVLDVGSNPSRKALHSRHFAWESLPGIDLDHRARAMEILLDAVAVEASSDQSWMLDQDYADLLDADEQALADRVRSVAAEVASRPGHSWEVLRSAFERFGVKTG